MNPDSVLAYLDFVVERHRIWEQRQAGTPGPWTTDPILAARKFTNVFRILDPGTQFVLQLADEPELDDRNALMRCFLYRHTGNVEAWEAFDMAHGRYPTVADFELLRETWRAYRGTGKNRNSIFTGAYLVFPQSQTPGTDKMDAIVDLAARHFTPGSEHDIMPAWRLAKTQAERFAILRRAPGVGDFMSMQVLTDWGYLERAGVDREDEFVVAGPGARRGAADLNPKMRAEKVIELAHAMLAGLPVKLALPDGRTRAPSTMDIQNTLCEWSKYVRYLGRPPGKAYVPTHPGPQPAPRLPKHW